MEELLSGIVIYNQIYKENDALVAILTNNGKKVMFKARGIMRITSKNSPSCQIFTEGEYELEYKVEGVNMILKSGKVINSSKKLFADYKASIAGMIVIDLIDKVLIDNSQNIDIYLILKESLFNLTTKDNIENILIITLLKILKNIGTEINADYCSSCGSKSEIVSVNLGQGGYICSKCNVNNQYLSYPKEFLKDFRYLVKADYKDSESFKVRDRYIVHFLELISLHLEENCGIYLNLKNTLLAFSSRLNNT